MTIDDIYRQYQQELQTIYSRQEAAIVTDWVFESKALAKRSDILKNPQLELSADMLALLNIALQELLQYKPVQYVLGEAWFYHLKFKVDKNVLIPRPETEELVQWILDDHLKNSSGHISIIDIGTGSGCIPVALKKNLPAAPITAIDISGRALAVAKENAALNNVLVEFYQLDFLSENNRKTLPTFDIIVSNPPYIPATEKNNLAVNVTAFEPGNALFVPDESPFIFYEQIAAFAKSHLKENGKVYVEIHQHYGAATAAVFEKTFRDVTVKKDLLENDRMIKATRFL